MPGEVIPLTFYYRVDGHIDHDLHFLVDIAGPPGVAIPPHFHGWHVPLHARYPTTRWVPGEYVRDAIPIVIPASLRVPVQLRLSVRVSDSHDHRELVADHDGRQDTSVPLVEIDVVAPP
jgi:hypothetical protein